MGGKGGTMNKWIDRLVFAVFVVGAVTILTESMRGDVYSVRFVAAALLFVAGARALLEIHYRVLERGAHG